MAVFREPPNSAHLVPHHQSHESEERQREVRPGSSGGQRPRTPTHARRSLTQAGDLVMTKDAKYCTVDISTSSSMCCAGPGHWNYISSSWCLGRNGSRGENISPASAASSAETGPVMEHISPAPAWYTAPACLVEYVCPAPAVSIAEPAPTVSAAHDTVVEYIISGNSDGLRSTHSSAVCNSGETRSARAMRCIYDDCE